MGNYAGGERLGCDKTGLNFHWEVLVKEFSDSADFETRFKRNSRLVGIRHSLVSELPNR